ncbi:MAG: hypothetical protein FJX92_01680 [Bacteroidetes bacterium]|nr:hypothetical protein [Bacteroidota bacterium]
MKFNLLVLVMTAGVWTACEPSSTNKESTEKKADSTTQSTNNYPMPRVWEVKTKTEKLVMVTETHPKGASLSDLKVHFQGDSSNAIRFTDVDPVTATVMADLDKNGFDEIYFVTTSAGSGSYGNLVGVSSNKDKSLSLMYFPEMDPNDKQPGKLFDGYEGHDRYAIENNVLIRRFPYKGDTNNMKSVPYQIMMGEGGYIVTPKRN